MLGLATGFKPLRGGRGLTPTAESRRRRGARRPAPGGDCRCVAGQPGDAEDTYESSRHSQSRLRPSWSNVPQLQPVGWTVGDLLVTQLRSTWGNRAHKPMGQTQRQKGHSSTVHQNLSSYAAKCVCSLLLGTGHRVLRSEGTCLSLALNSLEERGQQESFGIRAGALSSIEPQATQS